MPCATSLIVRTMPRADRHSLDFITHCMLLFFVELEHFCFQYSGLWRCGDAQCLFSVHCYSSLRTPRIYWKAMQRLVPYSEEGRKDTTQSSFFPISTAFLAPCSEPPSPTLPSPKTPKSRLSTPLVHTSASATNLYGIP